MTALHPISQMNFAHSLTIRSACVLAALAIFAPNARAQYDPDWLFHVRAGVLVGFNVKADFSMSGQFNIAQSPTAGVYDDGYVRTDATGNAGGRTSFWGYQNASQYDASAQTLTYHQTTSYSASGSGSGDDSPYLGAELAGGGNFYHSKRLRIGWEVGAGMLPINIKDNENFAAPTTQNIPVYNTSPIIVPAAGFNGGSSGIGPTISATPSSTSTVTASGSLVGTQTLDAYLWSIKLGPTIFWDINRHFGLQLSGGPAVGIIPGHLKFDETITLPNGTAPHNAGQVSATEVAFGAYVNAILTFHVYKNADLYIGGQYQPLQDVTFSGQNREAHLKLGGQVGFMAGLNWPF